jgi:hypothetical protein
MNKLDFEKGLVYEKSIDRGADPAERIPLEPDLDNASVGSGV